MVREDAVDPFDQRSLANFEQGWDFSELLNGC